jgi:hypothetical protein
MKAILTLSLLLFTLTGCVSYPELAAQRTAELREEYPAGTSIETVQARWGKSKPVFSAVRPKDGWEKHPNQNIGRKLVAMEATTGKKIVSVDQYWGADGMMSLCYCWFYYDANSKIVDVEWQYKSD